MVVILHTSNFSPKMVLIVLVEFVNIFDVMWMLRGQCGFLKNGDLVLQTVRFTEVSNVQEQRLLGDSRQRIVYSGLRLPSGNLLACS